MIADSNDKVRDILKGKCLIPHYTNYNQLDLFQKQIAKQLRVQFEETEFKWVNVMDEVLEIWQEICTQIEDFVIEEFLMDFHYSH